MDLLFTKAFIKIGKDELSGNMFLHLQFKLMADIILNRGEKTSM